MSDINTFKKCLLEICAVLEKHKISMGQCYEDIWFISNEDGKRAMVYLPLTAKIIDDLELED